MLQIRSTTAGTNGLESHQRQLVDRPDPFYRGGHKRIGIPPTAVGGSFRSVLQRRAQTDWNPANGSWWIVQILSEAPIVVESDPNHPPTSVGGIWKVQRPWVVERI